MCDRNVKQTNCHHIQPRGIKKQANKNQLKIQDFKREGYFCEAEKR